jgi:hypothetical protein
LPDVSVLLRMNKPHSLKETNIVYPCIYLIPSLDYQHVGWIQGYCSLRNSTCHYKSIAHKGDSHIIWVILLHLTFSLTFHSGSLLTKSSCCLCVCPILSNNGPFKRFSRNLVWTICHYTNWAILVPTFHIPENINLRNLWKVLSSGRWHRVVWFTDVLSGKRCFHLQVRDVSEEINQQCYSNKFLWNGCDFITCCTVSHAASVF